MQNKKLIVAYNWAKVNQDTRAAAKAIFLHSCVEVEYGPNGKPIAGILPRWLCPYFKGDEEGLFLPEIFDSFDKEVECADGYKTQIPIDEWDLAKDHICRVKPKRCSYSNCPVISAIYMQNAYDVETDTTDPLSVSDKNSDIGQDGAPIVKAVPDKVIGEMIDDVEKSIAQSVKIIAQYGDSIPTAMNFAVSAYEPSEIEKLKMCLYSSLIESGLVKKTDIKEISLEKDWTFRTLSKNRTFLARLTSHKVAILNDFEEAYQQCGDKDDTELDGLADTLRLASLAGTSIILVGNTDSVTRFLKSHTQTIGDLFQLHFSSDSRLGIDEVIAFVTNKISKLDGVASLPKNEIRNFVDSLTKDEYAYSAQNMADIAYSRLLSQKATGKDPLTLDGSKSEVLNAAIEKLDSLVGLNKLKKEVLKYKAYAEYVAELEHKPLSHSNHMIFLGNPGTGKTTVARIMADILYGTGLLPTNNLTEITVTDLIANYLGQTQSKTRSVLTSAMGGVLFIDEAYVLASGTEGLGRPHSFNQEALAEIVQFMENHRNQIAIIFAGYTKEMNQFMNMNPGLRSRINTILTFPDYSADELMEICDQMLTNDNLKLTAKAAEKVHHNLAGIVHEADSGNARYVRNLVREITYQHALAKANNMSGWKTDVVSAEEIDALSSRESKDISKAWAKLDRLVGLHEVKKRLRAFAATTKYSQELSGHGIEWEQTSPNMVFIGNAGTGKTTIAEITAEILCGLGIVAENKIVTINGADLTGPYLGQSARNTKEILGEAKGGVLFIDEAYAIAPNYINGGYAQEILPLLMTFMEKNRHDTAIIFAGYEKEMQDFLDRNSGMRSRISLTLNFADYNTDELLEILEKMFEDKGIIITEEAQAKAERIISKARMSEGFGNARFVRNIVDNAVEMHALRIEGKLSSATASKTDLLVFDENDFDEEALLAINPKEKRQPIGFAANLD